MITIDRARAIRLLEEVVAQQGPGYIYEQPMKTVTDEDGVQFDMSGCFYESQGAPSCGVGRGLAKAGVPLSVLDAMDQQPGDTSLPAVIQILETNDVELTPEALTAFTKFQESQDLQNPWSVALAEAKEAE